MLSLTKLLNQKSEIKLDINDQNVIKLTMNNSHYVLSSLATSPQYYDDVIKLIEKEFNYSDEYSFEKDFAPLMNPLNFNKCLIIIDSNTNELCAHLSSTTRTMIKKNLKLKVSFIGGIVTSKKHRGNHLFKMLMNKTIENNSEVGLFFLWSDLKDIYEKFNFHLAGGLIETGKQVILSDNIPNDFIKTKFSKLTSVQFKQIIHLYNENIESKLFSVVRENKDWETIKEMDSIDLYINTNENNAIIEYFCYGKGRDLTCTIHEICSGNINPLIQKLINLKLWLPESFESCVLNTQLQYLAFIRLGNLAVLNDFLFHVSNNRLTIKELVGDNITFSFNEKEFVASQKDFLHYIFGPSPLKEFKAMELSPYISGADSV